MLNSWFWLVHGKIMLMTPRFALIAGTVSGMVAVLLGAFGAHGLQNRLIDEGRFETYNLAVEYQFYHAMALLITGILMKQNASSMLQYASISFSGGTILFSGSLYLLTVLNLGAFGAITPLGGILFLSGWLFLLMGVIQKERPHS